MELAGIAANKNAIPFDEKPPAVASGIRLGTPAVTTRGMKEPEMEILAEAIDEVTARPRDEAVLGKVRRRMKALCEAFPWKG